MKKIVLLSFFSMCTIIAFAQTPLFDLYGLPQNYTGELDELLPISKSVGISISDQSEIEEILLEAYQNWKGQSINSAELDVLLDPNDANAATWKSIYLSNTALDSKHRLFVFSIHYSILENL